MDPTGPPPPNPRFGSIPPNPRGVTGAAAGGGHRRAYSETFLRLPDDLLFDSDPDFGISDIDFPSLSDETLSAGRGPLPVDSGRSDPPAAERPAGGAHLRSLSVDAAFFESLAFQGAPAGSGGSGSGSGGGVQDRKGLHRRSGSMDGATSLLEGDSAAAADYKKAMAPDKLAELALIDPKRAKRLDFFDLSLPSFLLPLSSKRFCKVGILGVSVVGSRGFISRNFSINFELRLSVPVF